MNVPNRAVISSNATPLSSCLKESVTIYYSSLLNFKARDLVMSASKTDPRLATVQPDLLLSFSLSYFCYFYHVTIFGLRKSENNTTSFPRFFLTRPPQRERVTRKRRPWERGYRNTSPAIRAPNYRSPKFEIIPST